MRPDFTGYAQVHGRNSITWEDKFDKDVYYVDYISFLGDGKIYMGNGGEVMKAFSIKDGCGVYDILIPSGVVPIILTGRKRSIVENRCSEIGIKDIYQGVLNKVEKLSSLIQDFSTVAMGEMEQLENLLNGLFLRFSRKVNCKFPEKLTLVYL